MQSAGIKLNVNICGGKGQSPTVCLQSMQPYLVYPSSIFDVIFKSYSGDHGALAVWK